MAQVDGGRRRGAPRGDRVDTNKEMTVGFGIGRMLRRVSFEVVPGARYTLEDVARFRRHLLGPVAPFNVYGRWRALLTHLVDDGAFRTAGLPTASSINPGKQDRQLIALQLLRGVVQSDANGAVVELGSFQGHMAIQIATTMRELGDTSPVYLFDSFEGLPSSRHPGDVHWQAGDLAEGFEAVQRRFTPFANVQLVKGWFEHTLPRHAGLQVKFAHVDADLYESVVVANGWLLDRIVPGGVVVYDDYGFANCPGALKAVDETLGRRGDYHRLFLPTGQFVGIRR